MLTILLKSVSERKLGSFRTSRWKSSDNLANTLTETFWNVRSSCRKFTFIEYLQLKVLLGKASLTEVKCCYDAPGVLTDELFISALRAWKTDLPESLLWKRLQLLQRLEGRSEWSLNLFYTYDNVIKYDIELSRRSIRKVKKYSGYVRNSSAVGSKRGTRIHIPEPEIGEWNTNVEKDYYLFLTVGEFDSGPPGNVIFTLKRTKSSKRKPRK